MHEPLEPRQLLAADVTTSWQNAANPLDVNNDENVTPLDALLIVNQLIDGGPRPLGSSADAHLPMLYLDVDGNGTLTEQDFGEVVAHLSASARQGNGATGYADGEAGSRGPDESVPSSSGSPLALRASRHDAVVQLADDLMFAIDVRNGPTRQFQLMRPGDQNQAQASGESLDAAVALAINLAA